MHALYSEIADEPVRGDVVMKALDKLNVFGVAFREVIVYYLENRGITLDKAHCYSLREIERHLRVLFGEQVTPRIMKMIEAGIKEQYYS